MLKLPLTNIYADFNTIYLFNRVDNKLNIMQEQAFKNYYYEPTDNGMYYSNTGIRLRKITVKESWKIKQEASLAAFEADLSIAKRFMQDNVEIQKVNLRWMMMDIETLSADMPDIENPTDKVSCIGIYDNFDNKGITFWLPNYKSEEEMICRFGNYIKERRPDILFAYNGNYFDFPYIFNRFPWLAEYISPINKTEYSNKYPAGLACLDYLALLKKMQYKNKTYKKFSLAHVYADITKTELKVDKPFFGELTEDIKTKNMRDVKMMLEIEKHQHLIDFYDEQRRITKCIWLDFGFNSRLVDNLFLMDAHSKGIVLPSKPHYFEKELTTNESDDSIVGGHVYCKSGVYENVHCFDVGGAYPSVIQTFCLDPANKFTTETEDTIKIRRMYIKQNIAATMPSVCKKLMEKRKELKTLIANEKNDITKKLYKQQDDAYKTLVNSVYGIALLKANRLYDEEIGAAITFLVRSLVRYSRFRLNHWNCQVIYGDTDSIMVKSTKSYQEIYDYLNTVILKDWLRKRNKIESCIKFGYDGMFKSVFFLTKKRYTGILIDKNGIEEKKTKGLEQLRSDSSEFQSRFQEELFNRILSNQSEEIIKQWISEKKNNFKTNRIEDISFPCKLGRDYKNIPIHIRALHYTQSLIDFKKRIGEDYYYTFIIPTESKIEYKKEYKLNKKKISEIIYNTLTDEQKKEVIIKEVKKETPHNVIAFDLFHNTDYIKQLDYTTLIERNITKKIEPVFEALGWKIDERTDNAEQTKKRRRTNKNG